MLEFKRLLTVEGTHPFDQTEWETDNIEIFNKEGKVIYSCPEGEFPEDWSRMARQTVASKYFRESRLETDKETSVKSMIERVTEAVRKGGTGHGYFKEEDSFIFKEELIAILVSQMASFNSPVWFNLGVPGVRNAQCSACFINDVGDSMDSIADLAKKEMLIFKEGSGSGVNFSNIRGSNERIRGGGTASGPVSFMEGLDAFANVILSGGRTRRAARMCILNGDHPDIQRFIQVKAEEEDKATILAKAGVSVDFRDKENVYAFVKHQSSNLSVRLTDEFMGKVRDYMHYGKDTTWELKSRVEDTDTQTVSVGEMFDLLAEAAHKCGDPGVQFHDSINAMNTCSNDDEIHGSNPCAEFVWLNNSACNLASLNLIKFTDEDRTINIKLFRHVVRLMIIAQDILVEISGFPTTEIRQNSVDYRPLGLGYANIGGLLMSWGLPYDSDDGRNLASSITSFMTGVAYQTSMELAQHLKPFAHYKDNKEPMEDVLDKHYKATRKLVKDVAGLAPKAVTAWQEVMGVGCGRRRSVEKPTGFRNCQTTLLAPTGTISFMMDCATSGCEPDIGLKKTKLLVGGSQMEYVNPLISKALEYLGYDEEAAIPIIEYIEEEGHVEGSGLKHAHYPIFDCAYAAGKRSLSLEAHVDFVAAIQPFVSGAISKTFNTPNDASVMDVKRTFLRAWEKGVKSITVYREGSKLSEPMRVKEILAEIESPSVLTRTKLPQNRPSDTHAVLLGGSKLYLTVGKDPETMEPQELFIRISKYGATVGGLLDAYATLFSKALQFGIPLEEVLSHMESTQFAPSGITDCPDIPLTKSIMDYIARHMKMKYLNHEDELVDDSLIPPPHIPHEVTGEICPECGAMMMRNGATCLVCTNCATSTGVCG
jgi:ribonucleoside-diphosphate reductase alpha chain